MSQSEGRFVWHELITTDVAAAKIFYSELLGWGIKEVSVGSAPYILFTVGDITVSGLMGLSEDERQRGARPNWIGYVGCSDVDAAAERIGRLGGAVHVPPQEIPQVSRFAIIADPHAATLGLLKWLDPGRDRAVDMDARGQVGWHELLSGDCKQSLPFYSKLFGWEKTEPADVGEIDYQLFCAAGQMIGGILAKPPAIPAPFWLLYFNVDDVDVAMTRIQAAGGHILFGPSEVLNGWAVQCLDPQGVMFALMGQRSQAAIDRALTSELRWSNEWKGLSINGRVVITRARVSPNKFSK